MNSERTSPRPAEGVPSPDTGAGVAAAPLLRRLPGRHAVIDPAFASESLDRLLANPDRYFDGAYSRILKTDATTSVCAACVGGRMMVIKRYNLRNGWHAIKRAVRPSRAARCWRVARAMRAQGIAVAPPVAYLEERHGALRSRAWLLTLYREGSDLGQFLGEADAERAARVVREVGMLFQQLARHRFSHGDMKASNILVDSDTLWLIDLDAARAHRSATLARLALAHDVERFLRNWTNQPALQARFRDALAPVAGRRSPA